MPDNDPPPDPGSNGEPLLGASEQTLADSEQTLADSDQTNSDSDQTSADRDQLAADNDQAASDRDLAAGVDPNEHEASRHIRERTARQRDQSARARLDAAASRDATANTRDLAALARDQAALARDLAMAQREAAYEHETSPRTLTGAEIVMRAAAQRKQAAQYRVQAAEHRALAAEDRQAAADDRDQASRERLRALADRESLARELAVSETDSLTGARTRAAGLTDLEHEVDRCRRTGGRLVVAYVDVVGLKAVNDADGHSAGDELLKGVVAMLRRHLRPYDLIIRLGGDEFLCVISNVRLPDARRRFGQMAEAMADAPQDRAVTTGFAELESAESASELIARADGELIENRRDHGATRPGDEDRSAAPVR